MESNQASQTLADPLGEGPYLLSALLCERVIVEQDGVKSAFRIIDRITHAKIGPDPPDTMPPFAAPLYLLIKLKAGSCKGSHHLRVQLTTPQGQVHMPLTQSIQLQGAPDQGIDFVGTLQVRFETEGVYWFDIHLDELRLTRIPVRIIYHRRVQQAPQSTGSTLVQ